MKKIEQWVATTKVAKAIEGKQKECEMESDSSETEVPTSSTVLGSMMKGLDFPTKKSNSTKNRNKGKRNN